MSHRQRALPALVLLLWRVAVAEYSTKTELDYEFGDYRGKWCIDDHGFVYGIGEVYYPSPSACPCTCTVDGPVCVRPRCPRIHPRCTRIRYQACCPVCEAMARVCVYGGKTYRLLEEFRLSRCERCRCEANREVYCSISDCPAPHCVNPTYEPNHCCPVCRSGGCQMKKSPICERQTQPVNICAACLFCPLTDMDSSCPSILIWGREPPERPNCFAGNRVIPAGERVTVDERTTCYCTYRDGTWHTHPQATCEQRPKPSPTPNTSTAPPAETEKKPSRKRPFNPRLDVIP